MKRAFKLQMWIEHFSKNYFHDLNEELLDFNKKMQVIIEALSRATLSIQEIGEEEFLFVVNNSIHIKFNKAENLIVFQTLSQYVNFINDTYWDLGPNNVHISLLMELCIGKICKRLEDKIKKEEWVKRENEIREKLLKSYEVKELLARISDWVIEEKIDEVESEIKSLLQSEYAAEYIPDKIQDIEFSLRNVLTDLRAEQKFSQLFAERRNIDPDLKHKEPKIFSEYGFALFDYLMKNQLTMGRGEIADVAFFYRAMESDGYIHARIKPFKEWVIEKYGIQIEKIKSYHELSTTKRLQAYTTAKEVLKFK